MYQKHTTMNTNIVQYSNFHSTFTETVPYAEYTPCSCDSIANCMTVTEPETWQLDSRFIGQLDERLQNEFTKNLFQVIKSVQTETVCF